MTDDMIPRADADAMVAAAYEAAAQVCDALAVGYSSHKGAPPALADAAHDIRSHIKRDARAALDSLIADKVEEATTQAARDVLAERRRQVEAESWTPSHDDTHINAEMAIAAACYALSASGWERAAIWEIWPKSWGVNWFKPIDRRRDLVKAGALILAEIERLDRAALKGGA